MIPLVGLRFHGPCIDARTDLEVGRARLGRPVWNLESFLQNLELRLGLPRPLRDEALRVRCWSRRFAELAAKGPRFYTRSLQADPFGTTQLLLDWRDELLWAGWDGLRIPGGGERLDALAEAEASGLAQSAPGVVDRMRTVERELETAAVDAFEAVELAEDRALWPALLERILSRLGARGTAVRPAPLARMDGYAAGDLGLLQRRLDGTDPARDPAPLAGDGSLLLLRAETSWELAQVSAALLAAWSEPSRAVVRSGDASALDAAFAARGLASQGLSRRSPGRPPLQVLPLALEVAYAPPNPYRVLDLVTLTGGPFRGRVGRELARALGEGPGIGGRPWQQAHQRLRDANADERDLQRVTEWLELAPADPERGAPLVDLLAVAGRVREWLSNELAAGHAAIASAPYDGGKQRALDVLHAASRQVAAFEGALRSEGRERLRLVELRALLKETEDAGPALALAEEHAGRLDHVLHPAALRSPRDVVLWWHAVSSVAPQPSLSPWRHAERQALQAAGLRFIDGAASLEAEAATWRQLALLTRERLVLCVPHRAQGQELSPHPFWDEIAGRLALSPSALARLQLSAGDVFGLAGARSEGCYWAPVEAVAIDDPLPLPAARPQWLVEPARLEPPAQHSARSIEALVGCPLQWVLRYRAGLRSRSAASLPSGPLLNGRLGHRLVERLHECGALREPAAAQRMVSGVLDELVRQEAAVLLREGEGGELVQLRDQLSRAVVTLGQGLAAAELEVTAIEVSDRAPWRDGWLEGRLDLLLRDRQGRERVIDLKWGASSYREKLAAGQALQLATYAALRGLSSAAEPPSAAYYSLSRAELLTTQPEAFGLDRGITGPPVSETWQRLDATVASVRARFAAGQVPVTGVRRSLPVQQSSDAPASDVAARHLELEPGAACEYCDFSALCGRRWEECA